MQTQNSSIVINGTKYIPAKEAEVGFLLAIIGIVSGIILGFVVLKMNGLPAYAPAALSLPAEYTPVTEQTIPVESRDIPLYEFTEEDSEQGLRDITV